MTGDREQLQVELVDVHGNATGSCTVAEAHAPPGRTHRAFSVLLYDRAGRVLLQRRAANKTRFATCWANTCCGHPAPGQPVADAAAERLAAELGLAVALREVGSFTYRAADAASGRVEDEWDHVLVGLVRGEQPEPDPAEVSRTAWLAPAELDAALAATPGDFTPWLPGVLRVATGR